MDQAIHPTRPLPLDLILMTERYASSLIVHFFDYRVGFQWEKLCLSDWKGVIWTLTNEGLINIHPTQSTLVPIPIPLLHTEQFPLSNHGLGQVAWNGIGQRGDSDGSDGMEGREEGREVREEKEGKESYTIEVNE